MGCLLGHHCPVLLVSEKLWNSMKNENMKNSEGFVLFCFFKNEGLTHPSRKQMSLSQGGDKQVKLRKGGRRIKF